MELRDEKRGKIKKDIALDHNLRERGERGQERERQRRRETETGRESQREEREKSAQDLFDTSGSFID
jgi:hypothetical protein